MSDSTTRAIRLIKAEALRDAANKIRANKYSEACGNSFKVNYNLAMEDASDMLTSIASDLDEQQ